jgi:hypothetical protein
VVVAFGALAALGLGGRTRAVADETEGYDDFAGAGAAA